MIGTAKGGRSIVKNARIQAPVLLKNADDITRFVRAYNQHDLRLDRLYELLKKYTGL